MSRTVVKSFGSYAVPMSIDEEFGDLLNSIDSDFLAIEGLTRDYLDISKRYDEYSNEGLDTFSIEGNSNATGSKNYLSRHGEVYKSFEKLLNYQLLWRKCKELYGLERANQIIRESIEGSYMIHDMTNNGIDCLYCTTLTAKHIMLEGRPYNDVHSKPPKYADSFMGQIIELVIDASSRYAGALAIPDINVAFAYYTKKENLSDMQIKQLYQRLTHLVNNPYRSGAQSPFFNMSLFTKTGLIAAFGGYEYPDGSTIFDYLDEILKNQLIFAKYFGQGIEDENGIKKPVAFPVVTVNIIKDSLEKDYSYVLQLVEAFNKFDNVNFYIGEADKFASCCFSADTEVLTKSSTGGVKLTTFRELEEASHKDYKTNFRIFHNGSWVRGKVIKFPSRKMYKISTLNNKEIKVTDNHINVTLEGEKKTEELTTDDYLLFNTNKLDSYPESDSGLGYEEGFLIGMYLGDGSFEKEKFETLTTAVHLSINEDKYNNAIKILNSASTKIGETKEWQLTKIQDKLYPLQIRSDKVASFIRDWVSGDYCHEKELNLDCLLESMEFRKGIIDGIYLTDGGNSNRIYSTSSNLIKQLETLMTSLGLSSVINISDRTDEPCIIRNREYQRNYPLYCIRWYEPKNKRSMGNVYKVKNNSIYFKIKSIEEVNYSEPFVYCFEIENEEEPYFTLPNGIITHNCRLINDVSKKNSINSFGAGAIGEQITGSSRVISINLYDIALETISKYDSNYAEKYFELLGEKMALARDALISQRHIVDKRLKEGFNIFHNIGWIKLEDYFSTYGAGGLHEAAKVIFNGNLKEDYTEEELEWAKRVPAYMEKFADDNSNDFIKLNVEFLTPLESGAKRLGRRIDIKYNKRNTFVSNQLLPLPIKTTLARRLEIENELGGATSAGGILHIGTEGEMPIDLKMKLLNKIVKQYPNVEHFAFNKTSSYCEDGHLTFSNVDKCQYCGKPIVEKILRVIGYYKPVRQWSAARQEEFEKRYFNSMEKQIDFIQAENDQ